MQGELQEQNEFMIFLHTEFSEKLRFLGINLYYAGFRREKSTKLWIAEV